MARPAPERAALRRRSARPVAGLRHAADRPPASVGNAEIELLLDREGLRAPGDACGIPIAVLPRVHRVPAEGRRLAPHLCHRGILAVGRAAADTTHRDHRGAKPPGARGRGNGGIGGGSWGEKRNPQASFETGTTPACPLPIPGTRRMFQEKRKKRPHQTLFHPRPDRDGFPLGTNWRSRGMCHAIFSR